jgi:predicted acylesterase/phospholipase RssA
LCTGTTTRRSEPLRRHIEGIIGESRLEIPTYVTLAVQRLVHDPDDHYILTTHAHSYIKYKYLYVLKYVSLSSNSPQITVDALLASAALPFGIVPAVRIDKDDCVDGGVVDNCPIYPLTVNHNCSTLVVVRLSPVDLGWPAQEMSRWGFIDRLLRLTEMPLPRQRNPWSLKRGIHNDPPCVMPMREPPAFPTLLVLSPEKSLGGLFDGTMNFSAEYSRDLMERGYNDALKFLHRHAEILAPFKG